MENENISTEKKKFSVMEVLKKYGYYIAIAVLVTILAIAIIVTSGVATTEVEEVEPTNANVIAFSSPVLNGKISKGYSATELQYNKNLNVWELHQGLDYKVAVGTDVIAVYDGTVKSIKTNLLEGTVVEIDHGNNLVTTYKSLDSKTNVKVGDVVKKGDVIGKASNTATGEVSEEGEVHFEVWKDGNIVDPSNYLDISSTKWIKITKLKPKANLVFFCKNTRHSGQKVI